MRFRNSSREPNQSNQAKTQY
jgi:hypothetical protein